MLVSWNWLKDYVALAMTPAELADRLAMTGLNHEGSHEVGDDICVDLEVTSNRPDCLGHIGIAREISVVFDLPLTIQPPKIKESDQAASDLIDVDIQCPQLCPRYTARVVQGVKIGPSPDWLARRLKTVGIAVINNVVDISNYVLMEIGQPLHTFDYGKIAGQKIIVRQAAKGEKFTAIDHKTYELDEKTCVIADAKRAVALGGVMGGAETEVTDATTDVLVEAAEFDPLSIRATARKLKLFSPSSYRFERGVDSEQVDWASRRCCQLIAEVAGGQVASGVVDVGNKREINSPITLRLDQIPRVLGIDIPSETIERILAALGNEHLKTDKQSIAVQPPSWRRDLEREIDLIEEVARIHGYEQIPEDVGVRMAASHRRDEDRRDDCTRAVLTAAGYDEALTPSMVSQAWATAFSPWSDADPLRSATPLLRGADCLRKSLIPSLLGARRENEALSNPVIELFETANIYLPPNAKAKTNELSDQRWMLALTSGTDFLHVKGVIESVAAALNPAIQLTASAADVALLEPNGSCKLRLGKEVVGYVGAVTKAGLKQFGLRNPTTIAEVRLDLLGAHADFVRQQQPLSQFPAIEQDLNFIVEESVRWESLVENVRAAAGPLLEDIRYRETYRDAKTDGAGKKRLIFSIALRSFDDTLTGGQAEEVRTAIVSACEQKLNAKLLGWAQLMTESPPPRSAVVLVVDRLGTNCLGPYGNTWVETPNFNALAARGLLMENCLADSPDLTQAYQAYFNGRHVLENGDAHEEVLRRLADAEVRTSLITDDRLIAQLPATELLHEKSLVDAQSPDACVDSLEETALAKLFAEAVETLNQQQSPFLLWIHARGMGGPWDAPLALRQSLAAEDDPDPWPDAAVPSLRLPTDYDPDDLLPITQAYAAQVMLLDMCLGVFMDAVQQHPQREQLLTIVTAPRGFPLGEHHVVGDCETQLYGELLQVPCFLSRGDGQAALTRRHDLTQPPDVAATLLDWFRLADDQSTTFARSMLTPHNRPRDRVLSSSGEHRAIRTPAWFYRRSPWDESVPPGETPCELFRKPDDRHEVNEISQRCPQIVEQLDRVLDDCEQGIRDGTSDIAPLSEELIDGIG